MLVPLCPLSVGTLPVTEALTGDAAGAEPIAEINGPGRHAISIRSLTTLRSQLPLVRTYRPVEYHRSEGAHDGSVLRIVYGNSVLNGNIVFALPLVSPCLFSPLAVIRSLRGVSPI